MKPKEKFWLFMEKQTMKSLKTASKKETAPENYSYDILALIFFFIAASILNFGDTVFLVGYAYDFIFRVAIVWAASVLTFFLTEEDWRKAAAAAMLLLFFI